MSRGDLMRRAATSVVAGLFLLGVAACGDPSADREHAIVTPPGRAPDADPGHVGEVEGTDAFIAVVAGGGRAVVYVCDGVADIAEWFTGPTDHDGSFDLVNAAGAKVRGRLRDGLYTGHVALSSGEQHRFSAPPAGASGGLLRVLGPEADAAGIAAGWIVDGDGGQRGSLRLRGIRRPAPAVPGAVLEVDGIKVPVVVFVVPSPTSSPAPPVPVPYPNIASG